MAMIWRSVWHIESSAILARIVLAAVMVVLGTIGVRFDSPGLYALAGLALLVLIYRIRYKHL
jgi:hypothetical protein